MFLSKSDFFLDSGIGKDSIDDSHPLHKILCCASTQGSPHFFEPIHEDLAGWGCLHGAGRIGVVAVCALRTIVGF